ncbi:MAG: hypothetical protein JXQ27_14235 [Acidobacteria bacterium]|nr:hypothetical protein [Acidobacteriota bacterium]
MKTYLYLSIFPEALVASMLEPEEFAVYFAVGDKKQSHGQAILFEVDRVGLPADCLNLSLIDERCIPHEDNEPKRSVYLSIYRALEHVPIANLKNGYLVTDDGRVLELTRTDFPADEAQQLHLYQELCPRTSRAVSLLSPPQFGRHVTDQTQPISVPRIVYTELILDGLEEDPIHAPGDNIPFTDMEHLRDCLYRMQENPRQPVKTVIRFMRGSLLFRTIKNGLFVSDQTDFAYYPLPSIQELATKHYAWWRSAQSHGFGYS